MKSPRVMLTIDWQNQEWTLLPQRALHWPARKAVVIADVHFGKPAAFRQLGVPVPEAATARDLTRLSETIQTTRCEHLIFLGDLLHARAGRADGTMRAIAAWRRGHRSLTITLVRGNHDLNAGDPPDDWNIVCVNEPFALEGFALRHSPSQEFKYPSIAGHVHPCVRLRDFAGGSSMRSACFVFGEQSAILPAFGSFTGTHPVRPRAGDRIFAVGENEIIEVAGVCAA